MKPILRKSLLLVTLGAAAIGLSGCVYYPSTYGYGYGGGYAAPAYVAPAPVVSGSLFFGGGWGGGYDRGYGGGWGGDHDGGDGGHGGWGGRH